MVAMSVTGPPQWEQQVMSISNTRLSNWAQLMRARVDEYGESPCSSEGSIAWSGPPGTICTADFCIEATDEIAHFPNNGICDDSLYCNGVEFCDPLLDCQAGTPPPIDDSIECTIDACDDGSETIRHDPSDELCVNGDPCSVGTCDAFAGCLYVPIPGCSASLPTTSLPGRMLIVLLFLASGGGMLGLRRRRQWAKHTHLTV